MRSYFQLYFIILLFPFLPSCKSQTGQEKEFLTQIGICTSLNNHANMHEHGYNFIEAGVQWFLVPLKPHEEFLIQLEQARESMIPVVACNSFIPGNLKSVGPDAVHDQIIAYADTAFRRAEMTGIKTIVFGSGGSRSIPDGFDRDEATNQFVDLLKKMGSVAAKYDVTVVIEPLNKSEVNFINTVAEGFEIAKRIDHPNIQLLCDFFHMLRENEPAEDIIMAREYIKHIHIAEVENRTPPGIAGDDFRPYLRALKEIEYEGLISIEARWDNFDEQMPLAITALREQIEEIRGER